MFHGIELMSTEFHHLLVSYYQVTLADGTMETQKPGALQLHTPDLMVSFNSFQASVCSRVSLFEIDLHVGINFFFFNENT